MFTSAKVRARRIERCPDRFVKVNGRRVRYVEAGEQHGGVPLLLVHGFNGSCDYWFPKTVPALARDRHVIAPDLPGNGLSQKMDIHTLESYVDFIADLLDALQLQQVDLLGHSMGGQIAIAAASLVPDRIRRLVLMNSAGMPDLLARRWLENLRVLTDSSLREFQLYPTFLKIAIRAKTAREGIMLLKHQTIVDRLERITHPCLVLWGERDRVVPLSHAHAIASHIPGARLIVIPRAGHMPFFDRPGECARIVSGFLGQGTQHGRPGYTMRQSAKNPVPAC